MKKSRWKPAFGVRFFCALFGYACFASNMLSVVYADSLEQSYLEAFLNSAGDESLNSTGDVHLLAAEGDFIINAGLNDAWFNPPVGGQGFLLSVFPDSKRMIVAWFTFDTERPPEDVMAHLGDPGHRWLTAQGSYEGDTANLTIFVSKGGVFNAAEPAASTDPAGDGSMTLEFADCTAGLVSYEITSLGISGEIPIQRIVEDNVPLCEELLAKLAIEAESPEPTALKGITEAHNVVRASVNVPPLEWDPELAIIAQEWADACVNDVAPDTLIDHNSGRSDNYSGYVGENIYGSSILPTPQRAVDSWLREADFYDYDSNTCSAPECGHYTQVVWNTTERVGCGISECAGIQFGNSIVCNYSPGQDTKSRRPY